MAFSRFMVNEYSVSLALIDKFPWETVVFNFLFIFTFFRVKGTFIRKGNAPQIECDVLSEADSERGQPVVFQTINLKSYSFLLQWPLNAWLSCIWKCAGEVPSSQPTTGMECGEDHHFFCRVSADTESFSIFKVHFSFLRASTIFLESTPLCANMSGWHSSFSPLVDVF